MQIKLSRARIADIKKEILEEVLESVLDAKTRNTRIEFYVGQFGQIESYRLQTDWKIEPIEIHLIFTIHILPFLDFIEEMPELHHLAQADALKFLGEYFMQGGLDFDISSGVDYAIEELKKQNIVIIR